MINLLVIKWSGYRDKKWLEIYLFKCVYKGMNGLYALDGMLYVFIVMATG